MNTATHAPQPKPRLLRLSAVLAMTGIRAASTLYDTIRRGEFPKPVKVGTASYWPTEAVESWIAALVSGGDTGAATRQATGNSELKEVTA